MGALGQALRAKRKEPPRATLAAMADRTGVDEVSLSLIEGGKRRPRPKTIRKLAVGYGLDYDELLALAKADKAAPPVPETPFPAKGERGVTQVTVPSVTSRDRLAVHTSPQGEAEAKASEGEGQMSDRHWGFAERLLNGLPEDQRERAYAAAVEAVTRAIKPFTPGVARRGPRAAHPRVAKRG